MAKSVYAKGKIYETVTSAQKDLGLTRSQIKTRLNNDKYFDFYYID